MPDELRHLTHLQVLDRVRSEDFSRGGNGNPKVKPVEYRAHGLALRGQLQDAFSESDTTRTSISLSADELRALGSVITLEGEDAAYPLKIESLEKFTRGGAKKPRVPQWLLLSVQSATSGLPERAVVWVADAYRAQFLKIFEDYLSKKITRASEDKWETPEGNPANRALVANISRIRQTILDDLWQSEGEPPKNGTQWWELWLDASPQNTDSLRGFATALNLRLLERSLALNDRVVVWINATWQQLEVLPFTSVPIAEIRRPEFVDTIEDLLPEEQDEYVDDLASRVTAAPVEAPAVCHLDTGVARSHRLLAASLDPADLHTVIGTSGFDTQGHGTAMAGLALYGPLDDLLTGSGAVQLHHRLESVRVLPNRGEPDTDPRDYGTVTVDAVARTEATTQRRRVFCMPISTEPDRPGAPTLWSSTVDALAVGTDIVRDGEQLQLLTAPDADSSRLMIVAAGNVDTYSNDHRIESDTSAVEDPAQAWNALTVGAHTDLVGSLADPDFAGWTTLAGKGELSPHSRTSLLFSKRKWPIKPDICFEGGNVLTDGSTGFHDRHPLLSLRSTGLQNDLALTSANATSAATAQASRIAALTVAHYPEYWPETVRGLMVHAAEWTPAMRAEFDATGTKKEPKLDLLRRYGWGVPSEDAVLLSSRQSVTLVTQDTFVPFEGTEYKMRRFRLHAFPWPTEVLETIGAGDVTLKVTLSYFVEPSASRRGWRQRYSYASHLLRFDLKAPTDLTEAEFIARLNREAENDEDSSRPSRSSGSDQRWMIGPNQRNLGSLHQDIWEGSGQDLAASGVIGVYPVGGWWKRNRRKDRLDLPIRYSLIVSLKTQEQGVDLYTPIATDLQVPVSIEAT
ncbi:Subtilase family protein [Brevibacterium sp. Mu109]|uniref:S8 family peptidase n=1 Tax=Brevibacterium sp. Mu109 TaxID=1255669 RepID=UPI000C575CDE|nr:S8 family peptidase [Brevibacterium sp. Mu109]SMX95220.1 Subtilase family protein [Brevibacterium sp. Mu109]